MVAARASWAAVTGWANTDGVSWSRPDGDAVAGAAWATQSPLGASWSWMLGVARLVNCDIDAATSAVSPQSTGCRTIAVTRTPDLVSDMCLVEDRQGDPMSNTVGTRSRFAEPFGGAGGRCPPHRREPGVSPLLDVVPTTGDDTRAATRASGSQYLAAVMTEWASLANDALAHDHPETAALCLGLVTDTLSKAASCCDWHGCLSSPPPLAAFCPPPTHGVFHASILTGGGMADDTENIDVWIHDLRGRLDGGEFVGRALPILDDSDEDVPVEGHIRYLLENLASVENLSPDDLMYAEFRAFRQELLDELGQLRERLG